VWLVSGYTHAFVLLSIVIVTLPIEKDAARCAAAKLRCTEPLSRFFFVCDNRLRRLALSVEPSVTRGPAT